MKAMTRQQLAARAGVDARTLRNWIKPYQEQLWRMGMPKGRVHCLLMSSSGLQTTIALIQTHKSTRIDKNQHEWSYSGKCPYEMSYLCIVIKTEVFCRARFHLSA